MSSRKTSRRKKVEMTKEQKAMHCRTVNDAYREQCLPEFFKLQYEKALKTKWIKEK